MYPIVFQHVDIHSTSKVILTSKRQLFLVYRIILRAKARVF